MNFSADILVIGSGWAGFAAAMEALRRGHTVIMADKGPGASILSSGAIDVADAQRSGSAFSLEGHLPIEENLQEIIHYEPEHPYALLARQMGMGAFFDFLRESILETTRSLPLGWAGDLEKNRLQISGFGNLKTTALVPASMEDANVIAMNQAKLLVVGIRGFAPFQSRFIRDFLLDFQAAQPVPYLQFAGCLDLEIPGFEGKASLSDFEIAQSLDQENSFVPFAQNLLSYLQGKVYTHVLLPPVMGILNTELILRTLKRITGLKIAETLGSPINIPGIRLRNAIRHACESQGVQMLSGEARAVIQQEGQVHALELESNRSIIRLEAKAFILASGKYLGGGIRADAGLREPIFNSDLNVSADARPSSLTNRDAMGGQTLWRAGLRPSSLFQPFSMGEALPYKNVFAAGSVLGGYDYIHGRCGAGVAISTGVLAARNASYCITRSP